MRRRKIDGKKVRPHTELYIALLGLDFSWFPEEVKKVAEMWREGYGIREIAEEVGREGDEVFLLLLDLARKKEIESREGDLYGYYGI